MDHLPMPTNTLAMSCSSMNALDEQRLHAQRKHAEANFDLWSLQLHGWTIAGVHCLSSGTLTVARLLIMKSTQKALQWGLAPQLTWVATVFPWRWAAMRKWVFCHWIGCPLFNTLIGLTWLSTVNTTVCEWDWIAWQWWIPRPTNKSASTWYLPLAPLAFTQNLTYRTYGKYDVSL